MARVCMADMIPRTPSAFAVLMLLHPMHRPRTGQYLSVFGAMPRIHARRLAAGMIRALRLASRNAQTTCEQMEWE